jgi:hypothetical protein
MRSRLGAAFLAIAVVLLAASACQPQARGPLFYLKDNLHGAEPRATITIVGFDKSRSGTTSLVAWLTKDGYLCYGEVAAEHPRGSYDCVGAPAGLSSPGSALVYGKPIFMPGFGFNAAFGIARNITSVRLTIRGKVTTAQVRPLAGGAAAGVYAFTFRDGLSSAQITSVVGLDAAGHVVARVGPHASIMASIVPDDHETAGTGAS